MRTEYGRKDILEFDYSCSYESNNLIKFTCSDAKNYIMGNVTVDGIFPTINGYNYEIRNVVSEYKVIMHYENGTTKTFQYTKPGVSSAIYVSFSHINTNELQCKSFEIYFKIKDTMLSVVKNIEVNYISTYGWPYKNIYYDINVDDKLIDEGA